MGRFSDGLSHRMRVRRGARTLRHPAGVGVVMYCASCRAELLRAPPGGEGMTGPAQQAAFAAHAKHCRLQRIDRKAKAEARERDGLRATREARMRRWRWILAGAAIFFALVAAAIALAAYLL